MSPESEGVFRQPEQIEKNRRFVGILTSMLGADSNNPGYRNRYAVTLYSEPYYQLMAMFEAGLVTTMDSSAQDKNLVFFRATRAGCEYIDLAEAAIENALSE